MSTLARPVNRLADDTPVIGSEADIDLAFAELSWCDFKQRTADTLINAELDAVRRRNAKHYLLEAAEGQQPKTLKQRYDQLIGAIVAFASGAKEALLSSAKKGAKTRDFNLGTIGFRTQPEKLKSRFAESTLDDLLDVLLDRLVVKSKIQGWLSDYIHFGIPLGEIVRCEFSWNVPRIRELVEMKKISPEQLAELGLAIEREPEKVEVKLKS